MERSIKPLTFLLATLIALGLILCGAVLLPHERYYRYQAHDNGTTRKTDWIYERLHFDPTPIDVALIGTSRTAGGLSAPRIEREYCRAVGRRIHVANLALPETGRNMHFAIAKETLRQKSPKLLIVELNDIESRKPHRDFIYLADVGDVLSAPLAINLNYFSDLLRLPGRQANLFIETLTKRPKLRTKFDRTTYIGAHLDMTEMLVGIDGQIQSRRVLHNEIEMTVMAEQRAMKMMQTFVLPKRLQKLEYRMPRRYLQKIEDLSKTRGADVAYAYLPAYMAPAFPLALAEALAIDASKFDLGGTVATDPSKWLDATHLNADGAAITSTRFAMTLAANYPKLGTPGGC